MRKHAGGLAMPVDSYVVNGWTRTPTFPGFGFGPGNAASWVTPIWRVDYFLGYWPIADREREQRCPRVLPAPPNDERAPTRMGTK